MAQTAYEAPLGLIHAALAEAARTTGALELDSYAEVLELAPAVLENAARFATEVLSPLNRVGDRHPSRCEAQGVV
ncbi:MAG TPA: hypothetical protein VLX90_17975, partial [Steroidobacteraceae bacterium]|nr:hypothetical protein [Steroidobacteraceae bacterium]